MEIGIRHIIGISALLAAGSALASEPTCPAGKLLRADTNEVTGHYFQLYVAPGISWQCAKSNVAQLEKIDGVAGHLATITSEDEDRFVDDLRKGLLPVPVQPGTSPPSRPEVWVGGIQPSGSDPGADWSWDNGEGPISTFQVPLPSYSNWLPNEPNDNSGAGSENYLAVGLRNEFGWNDEGALGNIGGYIVEYDLPRQADCGSDPTGASCQTIKGQFLKIPAEWIDNPDDTIRFSAYEFTDPRVATNRCGLDPLPLFEYLGPEKTLLIPPYLCGSPKFVVVAVDGSDLKFTTGTVLIENDTTTVLPGNKTPTNAVPADVPYVCKDTKAGSVNPVYPVAPGEDPQYQDIVVYQTTERARMLESLTTDPQFIGSASEVTNGCGSSRGTGKETSYFVVGMHIDFGPLGSTPAGSHDSFVALTRYKLTLLQQSVEAAKASGTLKNGDSTKGMSAAVNTAISKLDRGDYKGALAAVQKFLKFVDAAIYTPVLEGPLANNYNGEHLMRGQNIEFTLRVKVIPFAP